MPAHPGFSRVHSPVKVRIAAAVDGEPVAMLPGLGYLRIRAGGSGPFAAMTAKYGAAVGSSTAAFEAPARNAERPPPARIGSSRRARFSTPDPQSDRDSE